MLKQETSDIQNFGLSTDSSWDNSKVHVGHVPMGTHQYFGLPAFFVVYYESIT